MQSELLQPIDSLQGVGVKRAERYQRLGIDSVCALLQHYPRNYLDLTTTIPVALAPVDALSPILATVTQKGTPYTVRKGLTLYPVTVGDHSGNLKITIFNNHYQFNSLQPGNTYLFYGKITGTLRNRQMNSPQIFLPEDACLRPIYSLTDGLTNKMIITNIRQALTMVDDSDIIPPSIREEYHLCSYHTALHQIHFPSDWKAAEDARRRLIFEELLVWQLGLSLLRQKRTERTHQLLSHTDLSPFLATLPFSLTDAQTRVIRECIGDCLKSHPMNRLVQGDVGSGKTMVAAALCYLMAQDHMQSAMMAPTEILAMQHYQTLSSLLAPLSISVGLLTGSLKKKEKEQLRDQLRCGQLSVVVGTHALLQKATVFDNLGLVITDEQHRFGVVQRKDLAAKGKHPHMLVMSATPIPRTLALILYGDLSISVIDELPAGRQPIQTVAIPPSKRHRACSFLRQRMDEGRQAYIVCPAIEKSKGETVSLLEYAKTLESTEFQNYRVGILHGKMPPAEKEEQMTKFANGDIQLLIATTVIEVGIDIPNATVIMIENAELYGLSQLHQLRGRVGRGRFPSTCILVSSLATPENKMRMQTLCHTNDGFIVAEKDLELRGPGSFFGDRQHGLPPFHIANLLKDMDLVTECRNIAEQILKRDPGLTAKEHRGFHQALTSMFSYYSNSL